MRWILRRRPTWGHGSLRQRPDFFVTAQETSSANRERPAVLSPLRQAGTLACLVALFAFLGPFGTYDTMGALERVGYWALALGANWLVCASVTMLVLRLLRGASLVRRVLAVLGVSLLAAVPGTGVVFTAESLFRPGYLDAGLLPTAYVSVAVVMLAITGLVLMLGEMRAARQVVRPDATRAGDAVRFLDRLPAKVGRDVVCLSMADHYVEVFTTLGSTLILMRFSDAVAELEGADGLRVHRSHWVSRRHVSGAHRRGGRTFLKLTGGREIPVSRGYLAEVRAAGVV